MTRLNRRQILAAATAGAALPALTPLGGLANTGANSLPASAPLSIARVGLKAQDAEGLARWYTANVGLQEIARDGATIRMGAGGAVLLEITEVEGLRRAFPSWAGLYHTAFLLPSRADLASWVRYAAETRLPVDGASDHHVSEAIYLTDPEGNGVEIYADRPQEQWEWQQGTVRMGSAQIDFANLMAEASPVVLPGWSAPAGTMVGHVHLQVGDAEAGARWWQEVMGFDLVRGSRDANFLSTGGYHHHIAVNNWNSRGAGPAEAGYTGLAHVTLRSRDATAGAEQVDPWGLVMRIEA